MRIPIDKQAHLLAGYAIALSVAQLAPVWVGFLVASLVGWIKEAMDSATGRGTPDRWDALATMAGALAGELAYQLLKG